EALPGASAHGRSTQGDRAASGAAGAEAFGPSEGHVAARHRGAAGPPGRPHQDEAVEESGHRLSRQHLPDTLRREDRAAYSRSRTGHARDRFARLRALPEGAVPKYLAKPQGHDPRYRSY